jgi:biopolymer transport protein ExbD
VKNLILSFCFLIFLLCLDGTATATESPVVILNLKKQDLSNRLFNSLTIDLNESGEIFSSQIKLDKKQLYAILNAYRKQRPCGLIFLSAPGSIRYEKIVEILDFLQSIELGQIVLSVTSRQGSEISKPVVTKRGKVLDVKSTSLFPPIPKSENQCSSTHESQPIPLKYFDLSQ